MNKLSQWGLGRSPNRKNCRLLHYQTNQKEFAERHVRNLEIASVTLEASPMQFHHCTDRGKRHASHDHGSPSTTLTKMEDGEMGSRLYDILSYKYLTDILLER